jgi:hypothetical protein
MNYESIYFSIVENARSKNRIKSKQIYYENHHITPKCLGGSDDSENMVLLTAKEHFICHKILCLIHPDSNGLKFAFWAMCNQVSGDVNRDYIVSSNDYNFAKTIFSEANSILHKGKKLSSEHKSRISNFMKNSNPMKGKIGPLNPLYKKEREKETILKISETKLKNPEKNALFKGMYKTPKGDFLTSKKAGIANAVDSTTVCARCKSKNLIVINKKSVAISKDLKPEYIGKTYKDLGWDFIPLPRK